MFFLNCWNVAISQWWWIKQISSDPASEFRVYGWTVESGGWMRTQPRNSRLCKLNWCWWLSLSWMVVVFFRFDLRTLRVDFVECLMRFLPTEAEVKLLRQYERDRKPLEKLSDEDRFMMQFSRIERLSQRMNIMTFMGNFNDNIQMLTPVRRWWSQGS